MGGGIIKKINWIIVNGDELEKYGLANYIVKSLPHINIEDLEKEHLLEAAEKDLRVIIGRIIKGKEWNYEDKKI